MAAAREGNGPTAFTFGEARRLLAGLPRTVIHRAQEVLAGLESKHPDGKQLKRSRVNKELPQQLALFAGSTQLTNEILELDIDAMSPLETITKLYELKQKAKEMKVD